MGQRRTEVLRAAIELLDEVGLDALTMRLLASRLGVRASALYRHYPSKQALLDAMVAHLVGPADDVVPPAEVPWDELLRGVASGMRETMLAHRDGARLISGFQHPGEEAVRTFERLIVALVAAGIPAELATVAVDTALAYVNGYTIEEQNRKTGTGGWPREDRDRAFHAGLDLIILGVGGTLAP
ncbi:TetR/AcrR family transcriptional regulator C-terminal domain-containing protein [Nonomuraea spiralis]|uniref:TetR/AcrR family transcriptional regulator C-terminal domain-containing protein n=1 Tax=Nonomuraea TaxID=83681 RepID=UPI000F77ACD3|nr:TetR/AcrR family transcriptional regulator C-terminal domain-containing protein [Nonomuraea sp. WAC 01424]RSM98101.1 TetR family transcriptional regulator [Nonomuraea sp. WAC 01424]